VDGDGPTFFGLLDRQAERLGEREALVFAEERVTFREFADESLAMARRLRAAGVRRGQRVGLLLSASVDAFSLLLGAMRLGAIPVPINARFKALELGYVIENAEMPLVIGDELHAPLLREAAPAGCRVVIGSRDPQLCAAGERVATDEVLRAQAELAPGDDALILYTSGTTAMPKGAVHCHSALVAEGDRLAERLGLEVDDRFWTPLPFFHVGGICVLAATLWAGCASCQMGFFEPGAAVDQLERERITVAFPAFETIWLQVLNHPRLPEIDLGRLRLVVNAGTPGSLRLMQEKLPLAPQVSCFGGTETGGFACLGRGEDPLEVRLTTSGRPLRDIEIRCIDPETGKERPRGEVGELLVRGPTRFLRYHEEPELTARVIDEEGWFHTGDLGTIDEEGRVSFRGRLKDMLKVGGENVAAAEIETFLLGHPDVEIVQVVGVPDARYIEVPAAFVQLRKGGQATEQELIDFCRGRIATFKVPRYVRFVDEWPMSGTKVQKFRLREQLCAELEEAGITEAPRIRSTSGAPAAQR